MARKTPTRVLEARGAFRKNPQRKREGEPECTDPLGAPPGHLSPAEVACWQELAENAPVGVLVRADRHSVEMAACLLAEFRQDRTAFNAARISKLQSLLGSFGMNPSDRASLAIPKPAEPNPFAEFVTSYR